MSFQAYIDTIRAKTGLGPAELREIAEQKGLLGADVKVAQIKAWLKDDYDLGPGHAMALVATFKGPKPQDTDRIDAQFSGRKAHWRVVFDDLLARVGEFGQVGTAATDSYTSLLKGSAKFAIVAVTTDRLDVGIKLKATEPTDRFEAAGSWNSMVTHRARITDAAQLDDELLDWLRRAYEAA
jgi:hypothetical protein